jgi:hypothetical protein
MCRRFRLGYACSHVFEPPPTYGDFCQHGDLKKWKRCPTELCLVVEHCEVFKCLPCVTEALKREAEQNTKLREEQDRQFGVFGSHDHNAQQSNQLPPLNMNAMTEMFQQQADFTLPPFLAPQPTKNFTSPPFLEPQPTTALSRNDSVRPIYVARSLMATTMQNKGEVIKATADDEKRRVRHRPRKAHYTQWR